MLGPTRKEKKKIAASILAKAMAKMALSRNCMLWQAALLLISNQLVVAFQPGFQWRPLQIVKTSAATCGLLAHSSSKDIDSAIFVEGSTKVEGTSAAKTRVKTPVADDGEWPLLRELRRCVKDFELIAPGDRILLAVSGGKDSSTLAYLLQQLKTRRMLPFDDWSFVAVHLDQVISQKSWLSRKIPSLENFGGLPLATRSRAGKCCTVERTCNESRKSPLFALQQYDVAG